MNSIGVGIIGCGMIGCKRAASLAGSSLRACADVDAARTNAMAENFGCQACSDWHDLLRRDDIDIVVVAITNDGLADLTIKALEAGRHVLVEKPAARSTRELTAVMDAAGRAKGTVRVGFNHRYHPAFLKAFELHRSGALGPLMFIRAAYGHGGRVGYEKEWRMQPEISGGGELIDQGVHLIDLARCFLGDFSDVKGRAETFYWDSQADDNAFLLLKSEGGQTAFMQVSCTEWKNGFSFEIYGKKAKLHVTGLGGSYGVERLALYEMSPQMGPPATTIWEYPRGDDSWSLEFADFIEDIRIKREPDPGLKEALAALRVVESVYSQREGALCGNL